MFITVLFILSVTWMSILYKNLVVHYNIVYHIIVYYTLSNNIYIMFLVLK